MKKLTRRNLLLKSGGALAAAAWAASGCRNPRQEAPAPRLQTVIESIPFSDAGITLPHEHVLVDFIGAARVDRNRYDPEEAFQAALPHLLKARELGCRTLVECTPAYIGRDPSLLKRLALASRLNLMTNTGYYGAARNKFLPEHAFSESPSELAARWIREAREGIEGTGILPGFIKIGVDAGPLSELHGKLVDAAAECHRATGLTIAAHTGNGQAALEELDRLSAAGLNGEAFIWVHAQNESNTDLHARAAERGAWVEFDGIGPNTLQRHLDLVLAMKTRGLLERVLLSHDAGWYHVGEPGGGNFRPFDTLFVEFLPALRQADFNDLEIRQLIEINPREAFAIRVRER